MQMPSSSLRVRHPLVTGSLVRGEVVQHDVHVEVARHVQVNELEERQNVAAGVTEAVSCST